MPTAMTGRERVAAAMGRLLAMCGLRQEHEGRLLVRRRRGDGREAWFVTNPHREPVTETLGLPEGAEVRDLLDGEITLGDGAATLTVDPLDVRVLLVTDGA